jgi:hypothetical protein
MEWTIAARKTAAEKLMGILRFLLAWSVMLAC